MKWEMLVMMKTDSLYWLKKDGTKIWNKFNSLN